MILCDRCRQLATVLLALAICTNAGAASEADNHASTPDPHHTAAGFFDIHVCNWPDRPLFYMPLFSTSRYDDVRTIEVRYPDGGILTRLDLQRYLILHPEKKPEKHVFMRQVEVPPDAADGWYEAEITLRNGERLRARDYVEIAMLEQPEGMAPPDGAEDIEPPRALTWEAVEGAGFYEVFIRDLWDDERLIYTSKLLSEPRLELPDNLIKRGGSYRWTIHARDINEDVRLGDFNRGSMSRPATFSVRP